MINTLSRSIFKYADFQSHGCCSEVVSVCNYSEEIIQLSHVLQDEIVQVFFLFKHAHLLFSCKELSCLL